ncbi:MAG: site-specific DNA-methyltransferase [Prevotella sp.]|nr:site-specific DNA-methyltransferase [Prevotella sp.]
MTFTPNNIYNMDCLQGLRLMPSDSIDCCITSPPYYGLRDYEVDGQIGLERSPEEYIAKLTDIFREVLRVLKPEGTLWLNMGDSYAGGGKGAAKYPENAKKWKQGSNKGTVGNRTAYKQETHCKVKDLIGIPWMLAFALRSIGYYLRQDIVWYKPNAMPESVKDRCTKSHEYIFLLSKSKHYYYDYEAIKQPARSKVRSKMVKHRKVDFHVPGNNYKTFQGNNIPTSSLVNKRDVWVQCTKPSGSSQHFAAYPPALIRDCVLAGCPVGGIILDPFMGTGTTAMVALQYQRQYIGFELNPDYIPIIKNKIQVTPNMFV